MALWKITDDGPVEVPVTQPKKAKLLESDLEDWVVRKPELLGEPLLVIGRQVLIPTKAGGGACQQKHLHSE